MRAAEAARIGLIHGPAELLPVSSSAHVALLGEEPDRALEVAMHAGSAAAMLAVWRPAAPPSVHLLAGTIPAVAGVLAGDRRGSLPAGMLLGALAMALADRAPEQRTTPTAFDGLLLGLAQAAALFPGVSRMGATIAVARARRFERGAAARLSREIGVPVTLGAVAYTAWRERRWDAAMSAGAAASLLSTLAALPLLRLSDRAPLSLFAAYRAVLALALMGRSAR